MVHIHVRVYYSTPHMHNTIVSLYCRRAAQGPCAFLQKLKNKRANIYKTGQGPCAALLAGTKEISIFVLVMILA